VQSRGDTLQAKRETLGDRHPDTLKSIRSLADLEREEASATLGNAVEIASEVLGAKYVTTFVVCVKCDC